MYFTGVGRRMKLKCTSVLHTHTGSRAVSSKNSVGLSYRLRPLCLVADVGMSRMWKANTHSAALPVARV